MRQNYSKVNYDMEDADLFLNMLHNFSSMGAVMRRVMTSALIDSKVSVSVYFFKIFYYTKWKQLTTFFCTLYFCVLKPHVLKGKLCIVLDVLIALRTAGGLKSF